MWDASLHEPMFAPDRVRDAVAEILATAAAMWQGEDARGARPDDDIVARWAGSVNTALGPVRLRAAPKVEFLGVVNRPGEIEDRVVIRVELRFWRDKRVLGESRTVRIEQWWTLGRERELWTLRSVAAAQPAGALQRRLIPAEWADEDRLREEALAELAHSAVVARDVGLDDLVPAGLPPVRALRDLAQVDGRFDETLLDAVLRHLVEAWEEACTGSSDPLAALATPQAVGQLRHPATANPALTFIISDAEFEGWELAEVDVSTRPPRVVVTLAVNAVRYVVDGRTGAHVVGSQHVRHGINLRWILGSIPTDHEVWRLLESSNPALAIPDLPADFRD